MLKLLLVIPLVISALMLRALQPFNGAHTPQRSVPTAPPTASSASGAIAGSPWNGDPQMAIVAPWSGDPQMAVRSPWPDAVQRRAPVDGTADHALAGRTPAAGNVTPPAPAAGSVD